MHDGLNTIVLVLVYFLIVYLTAIRNGGQRLLPWVIVIVVEGITSYIFRPLTEILLPLPFFASRAPDVCAYVVLAGHLLVDVIVIILVGLIFPEHPVAEEAKAVEAAAPAPADYQVELSEISVPAPAEPAPPPHPHRLPHRLPHRKAP